jgi:hypothetical protein
MTGPYNNAAQLSRLLTPARHAGVIRVTDGDILTGLLYGRACHTDVLLDLWTPRPWSPHTLLPPH